MKLRYVLIAALLSFLLGLVAHAPAASLLGWFAGDRIPVQAHGVSGSLLSGAATQISRGRQVVARDLRWRFAPASLLLGRASYAIATDSPPVLLDGVAGIGLGGTVRLKDTRASGDLRSLAGIAGLPFIPVNGQVGLDLVSLTLVDQWPRSAQGHLQVIGLSWALGREPVVLGDFEAQIEDAEDGIVANVGTLKGAVEVRGSARLSNEGGYDVDLQLRAAPDAPPMVGNLLRSLGQPDASGYHRIRQTGRARPATDGAVPAEDVQTPAADDDQRPSYLLPG
ncbi:MAG: type II secretion system protein N [Sinimarinibacterium flocculans]|uniref:type II secretion system protein N n=1 Tax=Sinimarinibacterium flocculans TaxID=985250 RepID=UPI003C406CA9